LNRVFSGYGAFLNSVVNFVIVAFAMFVVVRAATAVQNFRRKEAESDAALPLEVALLQEIRDLLVAGQTPTGTPKP
jgi:large conductance mechanosensitive channel